ncbi:hypothetical protein CPB86DRAFT_783924 [Serendipita vermifera]|nr:hypothetical protein CPB86DRAFT_783924 [Serendipita vermifera]
MSGQHPFFGSQRRTASGQSRNDTDSTFQQIEDNGFDTKTSSAHPKGPPWKMYNEKASIYDKEMLKEWGDILSILLIFVSNEEDEGVIGHGWFASRREDPYHKLANILRLITILIFSHLYYFYFQSRISVHLDGSFIRWAWTFEKIELSDAILYNTRGVSDQVEKRERFDPGQFKPRWLIQITFYKYGRPGEHDVRLVKCRDENEAVEGKRYTALSYPYEDARDLFKEWYPNVREGDIPLRDRYYPTDRNGNPICWS